MLLKSTVKLLVSTMVVTALLAPTVEPVQAQKKSPIEARIKWGDDLGDKSRVLSLVDFRLCYRAPCPGRIFMDAEGKRFGVVRIDFGVEDSITEYNKVSGRLQRCGARLRGNFRRGSRLDDQPLIDLVVEEIIEGHDPTCK